MKITCSACGTSHKSNAKLEASLEKLQPGQKLRLKCSHCGEALVLGREDLRRGGSAALVPPGPPDTGWLKEGVFSDEEVVADIPQALVLMKPGDGRERIVTALTGLGYKADIAEQTALVLKRMYFTNYSCIIVHTPSIDGDYRENRLHRHLCSMDMSRRRYMFYVLVGPDFKTLYNLQALSNSVNLVVNESDLPYFGVILRKAIPEYEELFGPYMDELKIQGK